MNQKCCTTCPHVDVNRMTDERYCSVKDYKPIRLRWHHYRPDWCPLLRKDGKQAVDAVPVVRGRWLHYRRENGG